MTEEFDALLSSESKGLAVKWLYGEYSREDLMRMDPVYLRALFRERIHHTIEVEIYPILLGRKELPPRFGLQPQLILDVWKERGFEDGDPDFEWGKRYLDLAARMRAGEKPQMEDVLPEPFTDAEMAVVRKLLWGRRSIRDWIPGKTVPEDLIQQILEAGRAAPTGCNLDIVRFIVIRDRETAKMVWSDIPTPMESCVLIVICYDRKVYETVGHDRLVPHNMLFDCAAAADHMCLMAHALGLGAVWLSCTAKTAKTFKKHFGLPDPIEQALHIAVGYTAIGSIKSERMPVGEMMLTKPGPAKG
ncbi:MAG: nitroreductase family protein [Deltaproteobacteria bacterium]|nr:nitroreductase family protein [Deltaproteobacteria bacterium]